MGGGCTKKQPPDNKPNEQMTTSQQTTKSVKAIDYTQYFKLNIPLEDEYVVQKNAFNDSEANSFKLVLKKDRRIERIAIKIQIPQDQEKRQKIEQKLRILLSLEHPLAQKQLAVHYVNAQYVLIRETVSGKSLSDIVQGHGFSTGLVAKIIQQTLQVLSYLHKRQIVHGAFCPNSLKFLGSANQPIIILLDYGILENYYNLDKEHKTKIGTEQFYRCPESFRQEISDKSDIWSVGVLLFYLITGILPFQGADKQKLRTQILKGIANFDIPELTDVPNDCVNLLKKMLRFQPYQRPSAEECLKNPWFKLQQKHLAPKEKKHLQRRLQQLHSVQYENKVQQATMMILVDSHQSQKQKDRLMNTFKKMDIDQSGALTKEELLQGLIDVLGQDDANALIDDLFSQGDFDGQGEIDVQEFMQLFARKSKLASRRKIKKLFKSADYDNSGCLDIFEIRQLLLKINLSEEQFQELMKIFDKDGDGNVTIEEFTSGIMSVLHKDEEAPADNHKLPKTQTLTPKEPKKLVNVKQTQSFNHKTQPITQKKNIAHAQTDRSLTVKSPSKQKK